MLRLIAALAVAAALATVGLALSTPSGAAPSATKLKLSAKEMVFTPKTLNARVGLITFAISNKGKIEHNLKISGKASKKVQPGQTVSFAVTIKKAGRYAFFCGLPGHAAAGMKGVLVVKK